MLAISFVRIFSKKREDNKQGHKPEELTSVRSDWQQDNEFWTPSTLHESPGTYISIDHLHPLFPLAHHRLSFHFAPQYRPKLSTGKKLGAKSYSLAERRSRNPDSETLSRSAIQQPNPKPQARKQSSNSVGMRKRLSGLMKP